MHVHTINYYFYCHHFVHCCALQVMSFISLSIYYIIVGKSELRWVVCFELIHFCMIWRILCFQCTHICTSYLTYNIYSFGFSTFLILILTVKRQTSKDLLSREVVDHSEEGKTTFVKSLVFQSLCHNSTVVNQSIVWTICKRWVFISLTVILLFGSAFYLRLHD